MPPKENAGPGNALLAALPPRGQARFLADCERVDLVSSAVLAEAGERIRHVYFPVDSVISLVAPVDGRARLEIGLVGNEGMFGASLILGAGTSSLHVLVQGAGEALRIGAAQFQRSVAEIPVLQRVVKRYLHAVMEQTAQTAACIHFHVVEARLARWLLMTQDRVSSGDLHFTHEFLAYMLGVRRVGITHAATALQGRQLISYHRGDIRILDRAGLEEAACSCYEADKATYARAMYA